MSKALSVDLRDRVIAAIKGGMSCRQAAARFGVSASTAIRWRSRVRTQGDVRPCPLGGDRRSGHVELILGLVEARDNITLAELGETSAQQVVGTSVSSLWRFFGRRRITLRKSRRTRTSRAAPTSLTAIRPGSTASWTSTPIENALARLKALLRKAAARPLDQLWQAIADIIQSYSPRGFMTPPPHGMVQTEWKML